MAQACEDSLHPRPPHSSHTLAARCVLARAPLPPRGPAQTGLPISPAAPGGSGGRGG